MKKTIMTISNEGSAGKTTLAKLIKEALMRRDLAHATYLCDKDHTELIQTYGDEVKFFNLREDRETLINSLGEDIPFTLIDFPASSFDEIYKVFSDMNTFIGAFETFEATPIFVIPIVSDKSLLSVDRLAALLKTVTSNYEIVYVLNDGLMKNKGEIYANFNANQNAVKQLAAGIAKQVTISTNFTPSFASIVKKEKLREFLTKTSNPMDKILMMNLLKQSDQQFGEALGLDSIDDRTPLEVSLEGHKKAKAK